MRNPSVRTLQEVEQYFGIAVKVLAEAMVPTIFGFSSPVSLAIIGYALTVKKRLYI